MAQVLGWNRSSYYLMSAFALVIVLLTYVWWPLAADYLSYIDWEGQWWRTVDWLLIGLFLFMSLVIMAHADIRADAKIVIVGLAGGLVIEGWGTQTEIWSYYTNERPPLWIIPAWPIASLTIDRMVRWLDGQFRSGAGTQNVKRKTHRRLRAGSVERFDIRSGRLSAKLDPGSATFFRALYWLMFPAFVALMVSFVWPTLDKSMTIGALLLVGFLVATPTDHRLAVLTFLAGSGLGYFLERWGTTRECWTYYTMETPPLFAVLAHGMAAVAFWRTARGLERAASRLAGWSSGRVVDKPVV